jgi:hypothetical protein
MNYKAEDVFDLKPAKCTAAVIAAEQQLFSQDAWRLFVRICAVGWLRYVINVIS